MLKITKTSSPMMADLKSEQYYPPEILETEIVCDCCGEVIDTEKLFAYEDSYADIYCKDCACEKVIELQNWEQREFYENLGYDYSGNFDELWMQVAGTMIDRRDYTENEDIIEAAWDEYET